MADSIQSRNERQKINEEQVATYVWPEEDKTSRIYIRGKRMPNKRCENCQQYEDNCCSFLNLETQNKKEKPKKKQKDMKTEGCAMHSYKIELLPPVPRININEAHKKLQKKTTE